MDTTILEEIGFTEAEKKVYLALLELGSVTASPILEKTGLQNSVFYRTIHRLIEKGFVSFIKKGVIKSYKAANPEVLLMYLKERENKLKEFIPELKLRQKKFDEKQEAEVYYGLKGVKTLLYSLIEYAKKGEDYYFFGTKPEIYSYLQEKIYMPYDVFRKEKQINALGIQNIAIKKLMKRGRYPNMRYANFPIPPNIVIFRNKVALFSWENLDKPIGVCITSNEMSDQYKLFFKEIWKLAKP